jgi:hypothetical protein
MSAVGADMLLHVVFACECLVANGAVDALLAGVLLPMPGCVARCRECSRAAMTRGVWAWVFILTPCPTSVAGL